MTPEKFKSLSIKEQGAITKLVDQKMEIVSKFLRMTAKSVIFNARKQHINFRIYFTPFSTTSSRMSSLGKRPPALCFPAN
jgi:hypothetical protein